MDFHRLSFSNNRGSVMLMGLGMIILASTMIVSVTIMANKESNQRRYQRDSNAVREINESVQNLLSDQRFCSDIVKSGYATGDNTKISFEKSSLNSTSSYSKRSGEILEEYQKNIEIKHGYKVDAIELNNMRPYGAQGQAGEQIKTFDVTVHLKKVKDSGGILNTVSFGSSGVNKNNVQDHISLALTEKTGLCTAYKKMITQTAVAGNRSLIEACTALGGTVNNSFVCQLEKFPDLAGNDGILDYSKKTNDRNLSDVLCEMETNLLKKDRRSGSVSWNIPSAAPGTTNSGRPENIRNWTNFCKKPQWGGCYYDNKYYLQGEKVVKTGGRIKAKEVSGKLKEYHKKSTARRVARLYMTPPNISISNDIWVKTKPQFSRAGAAIGNIIGGGLGAMAWGKNSAFSKDNLEFGLGVTAANFLAISAFGLGPGLLLVGIVLAFGPKCDGAWIETTYVCKDGIMEKDSFRWRGERPKKSSLMLKCKKKAWENGGKVPSDEEIAKNVMNINKTEGRSLSSIDKSFLTHDFEKFTLEKNEDFENAIINDIKNAKSLNALMTDKEKDSDDDRIPEDGSFSPKVIAEFLKKEAELLREQQSKIDSLNKKIFDLAAESRTTGVKVEDFEKKRNDLKSTLNSLLSELTSYNRYQASLIGTGMDTQTVGNQMISLNYLLAALNSIKI